MSKKIDKSKLDVRKSSKVGSHTIYVPLTGYIEDNKRYVVEIEKTNRKLYNGEDMIENKIIIQSAEEVKKVCQSWNEIECKDCDSFNICELRE